MAMAKGQKEAEAAVCEMLERADGPVLLFDVACEADRAAKPFRTRDLFSSLFDYVALLPAGWKTQWMNGSGDPGSDSACYVVNNRQGDLFPVSPVPGFFDAGIDMGPAITQQNLVGWEDRVRARGQRSRAEGG